ncbi:hypothetical protein [Nocardioides sp. BYT-33-1]|uniref:hypothetical protein n=1 Tax=Nocardioides sp. BYT-33-1 TaxID=3416952 RepID=UPI003F53BFAD
MEALHDLAQRLLSDRAEQLSDRARADLDELMDQEWTIAAAQLIQGAIDDHTLTRADADVATEAARAKTFGTRTSRHMLAILARYRRELAAA